MINLDYQNIQSDEVIFDLTPMLDVIFILLIFFILSIGQVFQTLDLQLPSSVSNKSAMTNDVNKNIILEIGKKNYALNGKKTANFMELKAMIMQTIKSKSKNKLIVMGDKSIRLERLLLVLTFLQEKGIKAVNILMQEKNKKE